MIFFHNWVKFRPWFAMSITIINIGWIILMFIVLFIWMFIVSYSTKIICSQFISSFIIVLLSVFTLQSLQIIFCTRDPTHGIFLCLLRFFELHGQLFWLSNSVFVRSKSARNVSCSVDWDELGSGHDVSWDFNCLFIICNLCFVCFKSSNMEFIGLITSDISLLSVIER